jgi:hypothetical protein
MHLPAPIVAKVRAAIADLDDSFDWGCLGRRHDAIPLLLTIGTMILLRSDGTFLEYEGDPLPERLIRETRDIDTVALAWLLPVLLFFIGSIACDSCPNPPSCPVSRFVLTVSTPDGGAVSDVQATLSGVALSCVSTAQGASCIGSGQAGPLEVTAPGFQPIDLTATVTTTPAPSCGCPGLKLAPSNVTLSLAPDSGVDATTDGPATDGGGTDLVIDGGD